MKNPKMAGPMVMATHSPCRVLYGESGFSITELMVALLVGMLLIAASYATFIAQNRSYVAQEAVSEVNTQSNIAYGMLSNDLKMAGFGTPNDMNETPVAGVTSPVAFIDSNSAPDSITIVGGFQQVGTLVNAVAFGATSMIVSNTPSNSRIPVGTGLSIGLSFDGIQYVTGTTVTLNGANKVVTITPSAEANYPAGRPIYLVEPVTYGVNADDELRRTPSTGNADVVAENIEDLQLAYGLDADDNGVVDSTDYAGSEDLVPAGTDPNTVRAVRINILARSARPDPNFKDQGNPPPSIENHDLAATNDDFKRRWWQSIVTIRND